MKTRIISACIMLPLIALVYFGGYLLMAACIVVSFIGVHEFYKGYEAVGSRPAYGLAYAAIVLLYAAEILAPGIPSLILLWVVLAVMGSMIYGFNVEERKLEDMSATLLGILYCVLFPFHIVLIDRSEYSILIWLVFLASFGTDIMAYFVGMAVGKHKLCPEISPKKTVEGFFGGIVTDVVVMVIFALIYSLIAHAHVHYLWLIFIGIVCAVISVLGDLSASVLKRQQGIKDFGNIMPGHGGVMDRFDSVLFTVPAFYALEMMYPVFFG